MLQLHKPFMLNYEVLNMFNKNILHIFNCKMEILLLPYFYETFDNKLI